MRPYQPTHLELPLKINFLTLHRKQLYSEVIVKHTEAIEGMLTKPSSLALDRLSHTEFWDSLNLISEYDQKVDTLHTIWKKIEPLAHLDSKALLALYQEEVLPLERGYRYFAVEQADSVVEQLNENHTRLKILKSHIFEGLLYRAQAFKGLNAPRNVDDIVAAICYQINQLNLLKDPLEYKQPYSSSLNDDRRLTIHDMLKNADMEEELLHKNILECMLSIYTFPVLYEHIDINKKLKKTNDFCQEILINLDYGKSAERFFSQSFKAYFAYLSKTSFFSMLGKGLDFIQEKLYGQLFKKMELLSKLSYLAYFVLSFLAYHVLMQFITPFLFLVVSTAIFNTISSALFYAIAMAPAWWLAWDSLKNLKEGIYNYLVCWKKQEILDSLIALERAEHCIANKLSQVVVDIAHFDIEHLVNSIQKCQVELTLAKKGLKRFSLGEKKLCQGKVMTQVELVVQKIESMEKRINNRLKILAKHIASRINDEIDMLDRSFHINELIPLFPSEQLEKLQNFMVVNAVKEDIERFQKETNTVNRWLGKIKDNHFVENTQNKMMLNQPWGKHKVIALRFVQWGALLKAFAKNPHEREAVLELNNLLAGKSQMTKEHLCRLIATLKTGDEARLMMEIIQDLLFHTLDSRISSNASLLSKDHRDAITGWYLDHKEQIEEATTAIQNIHKIEMQDEQIAEYFELLDGADIYSYVGGDDTDLIQRQNLIRKSFETYQGEHSFSSRLIRFVPKNEQATLTREVTSKRLKWIISHLGKDNDSSPFEKADIELFQDMALTSEFNFEAIIAEVLNQIQNKASMSVAIHFLKICKESGIDATRLTTRYQEAQRNGISSILYQHQTKPSCAMEIVSLPIQNENEKDNRYVIH